MRLREVGLQLGFRTDPDKAEYYPEWIDKHGLRFIYRMYKEPHTRYRYFKTAFVFPIIFLKERLSKG